MKIAHVDKNKNRRRFLGKLAYIRLFLKRLVGLAFSRIWSIIPKVQLGCLGRGSYDPTFLPLGHLQGLASEVGAVARRHRLMYRKVR